MRMHEGFIGLVTLSLFSLFTVGVVAAGVESNGPTPNGPTVSTSGGAPTLAGQQELRVRFHRLWQRTARSHSGWERGLWFRGPILADDYARRAALVRFLRTELAPYLARERPNVHPIGDRVPGSSDIESFAERLDRAARSADARDFQVTGDALSVVLESYFAKDHPLIQKVRVPARRMDAKRVTIAGR